MSNHDTPCRITIDFVEAEPNESYGHYEASCVCGVAIEQQSEAKRALAVSYDHFVDNSHVGFMFIDFRIVEP